MPASAPYIPTKDSLLDAWALNFTTLLTAAPATYGQSSGTAASCAAAYSAWHSAYLLVTSKATKTANTVAAKNTQRTTMLATLRPVAQDISLNAAVTSANKTAIGVNPRTSTPQPITPPSTYPIITVQGGAAGQLYIRYRDSAASPSVKSKPYGVAHVQVRYQISATPVADLSTAPGVATITKTPYLLQFPPGTGGQCYLAGLYVCKNAKLSGFGPVVSFTVPTAS